MTATWEPQHLHTVTAVAVTCGAVSLARFIHAESRRRNAAGSFWRKCCAGGSVAILSSVIGSAVAAAVVERRSPWETYAASVLLSATGDVTSIRQLRRLTSTVLRSWLVLIDSRENANENERND